MSDAPAFLTINDYSRVDDSEFLTKLVRGKIVEHPFPTCRHGFVCGRVISSLANYAEKTKSGHAVAYSGIITQRNPDTLRGADASFYSFQRLPREADLDQYPPLPPEIIFEVKSPSDSWSDVTEKVAEYLHVGVDVACVIDLEERVAVVHIASAPPKTLASEQLLEFPQILPGFQLNLSQLFV